MSVKWKAFEKFREPLYVWATRLVAARFERERALVASNARRCRSSEELTALVDRLLVGQSFAWRETMSTIYEETAPAFARRSFVRLQRAKADLPTEAEEIWLTEIRDWFERQAGARIVGITATTRQQVRRCLLGGVEAGEGIPAIAKRLDALYLREIIPNRSVVIARTEVISASNLGNRAGAIATGLPLEHVWISTPGLRTRPAHAAASGQTRPRDEPYQVAGDRLMFPGDGSLGARAGNLVQCRCAEGFRVVQAG